MTPKLPTQTPMEKSSAERMMFGDQDNMAVTTAPAAPEAPSASNTTETQSGLPASGGAQLVVPSGVSADGEVNSARL